MTTEMTEQLNELTLSDASSNLASAATPQTIKQATSFHEQACEPDFNVKLKELLRQVTDLQNGAANDKVSKSAQIQALLAQLAELTKHAGQVFESARSPLPFNGARHKVEIAGNIRTFNLYLNVLVSALVVQLDLHRLLSPKLTTKELQQKKMNASTGVPLTIQKMSEKTFASSEPDYLDMAHSVFIEMKRGLYRGIHPDTFTSSQLLRGLKALSKQQ